MPPKRKAKEILSSDSDFESPSEPIPQNKEEREVAEKTSLSVSQLVVERAKSGRAECKKCGEKIANKEIRIGIVTEGDWGIFTRWQHLGCTVFNPTIIPEAIPGFLQLDSESQEIVRSRISQSSNVVDDDLRAIEPDELVRTEWTSSEEPHDDLLMPLLPYQKEGLGWMTHQERTSIHGGILADEMGMGKAQPIESLVLSPQGWRKIGELKIGDFVIGQAGEAVKVTGIYPQGVRTTYWVEFSDGFGVEVSDHHLWSVSSNQLSKPMILQTLDLFRHPHNLSGAGWLIPHYQIPIVQPVKFDRGQEILKTDYYILGMFFFSIEAWFTSREIFSVVVSQCDYEHFNSKIGGLNLDKQIRWKVDRLNYELAVQRPSDIDFELKTGVIEVISPQNLRLADAIKFASPENRLSFLQGLLDVSSDCNLNVSFKTRSLMNDFIELVQSLGGLAILSQPDGFSLTISLPLTQAPFQSPIKAELFKNRPSSLQFGRFLQKVIPLRKTDVICISVDSSDHLYVTEHCIVTHNTIQSISLLLSNRKSGNEAEKVDWDRSDIEHGMTPSTETRGNTLIVVPTIALRQWQAEILRFTRPGSLKVHIYHGQSRGSESSIISLCNVDVVLTSYKILEVEYRRATAGSKIECSVCGKKFYPEKLRLHRKYFCGETSQRTQGQSLTQRKKQPQSESEFSGSDEETEDEIDKQKKLISQKMKGSQRKSPSNKKQKQEVPTKSKGKKVLSESEFSGSDEETEDEIDKQKKLISQKMKGSQRKSPSNKKQKQEVPTKSKGNFHNEDEWYDEEVELAIAAASKRETKKKCISLLHSISWFRIICDEAHMIKDRSTSTAKAVFNLVSLNKWCLTGTPLQNRVGELYSLIRFLRLDPFAFYYCKAKNCTCKSLHYRFTRGMCQDCNHSAMQHFCHFNKHVLNPIKRSGYVGEGRGAMLLLKSQVLDKILLRRTKMTKAEDIQLPPRIVTVRMEHLDLQEDDFYQALYTQSKAQFDTYVAAGTVLNNYAHIFDILIRLRQVVDHPYLVLFGNKSTPELTRSDDIEENEPSCLLCHECLVDPRRAQCGHTFCLSCVSDFLQVENAETIALCPVCETPLSINLSEESILTPKLWANSSRKRNFLRSIHVEKFQSSTKLEALMQKEITQMKENDIGAKAIVFSQFVNFLDILEYRLQLGGIVCAKLVGSLSVDARDKIIKSFNEDPEITVLLISLKAGGVALNLTVANYIFVMDPWWNPAAEMQAIDRTHRIGQHKPIYATRFIIEDTIEERILQLQEKKKLVFDGTIGGDASSMTKLTVDDMRFLFQ